MEVVHQQRTAGADPKRVLVVGDWSALRHGQHVGTILCDLVEFAARASVKLLIMDGDNLRGRGRAGRPFYTLCHVFSPLVMAGYKKAAPVGRP